MGPSQKLFSLFAFIYFQHQLLKISSLISSLFFFTSAILFFARSTITLGPKVVWIRVRKQEICLLNLHCLLYIFRGRYCAVHERGKKLPYRKTIFFFILLRFMTNSHCERHAMAIITNMLLRSSNTKISLIILSCCEIGVWQWGDFWFSQKKIFTSIFGEFIFKACNWKFYWEYNIRNLKLWMKSSYLTY